MSRVHTVLVVEDDPTDQEILREAFQEIGFAHDLVFCGDGDEALEWVNARDAARPYPSLVLLDLKMPRMNGLELLERFQRDVHLRRLPVVVLTTSWSQDDIALAYDRGVNSFLIKPVLFDELVEMMSLVCRYWLEISELPVGPHLRLV